MTLPEVHGLLLDLQTNLPFPGHLRATQPYDREALRIALSVAVNLVGVPDGQNDLIFYEYYSYIEGREWPETHIRTKVKNLELTIIERFEQDKKAKKLTTQPSGFICDGEETVIPGREYVFEDLQWRS